MVGYTLIVCINYVLICVGIISGHAFACEKMDKASIVGDAVLYVQDLQIQAKKLKAEIAGLEASLSSAKRQYPPQNLPNKRTDQHVPNPKHDTRISRKILQVLVSSYFLSFKCWLLIDYYCSKLVWKVSLMAYN